MPEKSSALFVAGCCRPSHASLEAIEQFTRSDGYRGTEPQQGAYPNVSRAVLDPGDLHSPDARPVGELLLRHPSRKPSGAQALSKVRKHAGIHACMLLGGVYPLRYIDSRGLSMPSYPTDISEEGVAVGLTLLAQMIHQGLHPGDPDERDAWAIRASANEGYRGEAIVREGFRLTVLLGMVWERLAELMDGPEGRAARDAAAYMDVDPARLRALCSQT